MKDPMRMTAADLRDVRAEWVEMWNRAAYNEDGSKKSEEQLRANWKNVAMRIRTARSQFAKK